MLQTQLIIKGLIKHENKFNRKVFNERENPENQLSGFAWTFLGSLHNETLVKYVFQEMLWKKYFIVYPRLKETLFSVLKFYYNFKNTSGLLKQLFVDICTIYN